MEERSVWYGTTLVTNLLRPTIFYFGFYACLYSNQKAEIWDIEDYNMLKSIDLQGDITSSTIINQYVVFGASIENKAYIHVINLEVTCSNIKNLCLNSSFFFFV